MTVCFQFLGWPFPARDGSRAKITVLLGRRGGCTVMASSAPWQEWTCLYQCCVQGDGRRGEGIHAPLLLPSSLQRCTITPFHHYTITPASPATLRSGCQFPKAAHLSPSSSSSLPSSRFPHLPHPQEDTSCWVQKDVAYFLPFFNYFLICFVVSVIFLCWF